MLFKTHIALGLGVALYFIPHINNKLLFLPIVLIASILPDIENGFAYSNKGSLFKPLRWFNKSNWILHTYTFCIAVSIFLAFVYPVLALPFFLGYSFHLFIDAFTPEGIMPYWPIKKKSTGHITPGGKVDQGIFYTLALVDVALLVALFW